MTCSLERRSAKAWLVGAKMHAGVLKMEAARPALRGGGGGGDEMS